MRTNVLVSIVWRTVESLIGNPLPYNEKETNLIREDGTQRNMVHKRTWYSNEHCTQKWKRKRQTITIHFFGCNTLDSPPSPQRCMELSTPILSCIGIACMHWYVAWLSKMVEYYTNSKTDDNNLPMSDDTRTHSFGIKTKECWIEGKESTVRADVSGPSVQ